MSGLQFAIEFSLYLLSCLFAIGLFGYINFVFARKSLKRRFNIFVSYICYSLGLLLIVFIPYCYLGISVRFPSSVFACDDAAISLIFWVFLVLPCYVIFNITLFIILIIKILMGPKKAVA